MLQSFFSFIDLQARASANEEMQKAMHSAADASAVNPDAIFSSMLTNCHFMSMAINRSLDYSKWK